MKLALIRRHSSATGGAELYLQRLLACLVEAGHDLHLFAESWDQAPNHVMLHRVASHGNRATRPLNFAAGVAAELAGAQFDCVFNLERTYSQDLYRAGDGVHQVWLQRRREFSPWWRKPFVGLGGFHRNMLRLEQRTFDPHLTRRVIVNSEMVKRELITTFGFPADRIHLVRNGVDTRRFTHGRRLETRRRFAVEPDDYVLLFVGSGWERKGLRFLLEAFRRIPTDLDESASQLNTGKISTLKLLVVGKGRVPRSVPPGVIFTGPMTDIENAYAAADLFVFLPIYEPSANVCDEALAAGLPVVTTAQNGAAELIESGVNGTVISSPRDLPTIIQAITQWRCRGPSMRIHPDLSALSLDRNVAETLAVLELASAERKAAARA